MLILSDNEAAVLANILQRIDCERKSGTKPVQKKEENKQRRKTQAAHHLAKTLGNSFFNYIKL